MDKVIKNVQKELIKPMGFRDYINHLRVQRKLKKDMKKQSFAIPDTPNTTSNQAPDWINIVNLAVVVDGSVYDVIRAEDSFAEVLQKRPTFIKIENGHTIPQPGWVYENDEFIPFAVIVEESKITRRG